MRGAEGSNGKGERKGHNGSREKLTDFVSVGYTLASTVLPRITVKFNISRTWVVYKDQNITYKFKPASRW
jgi:hypothetical protein